MSRNSAKLLHSVLPWALLTAAAVPVTIPAAHAAELGAAAGSQTATLPLAEVLRLYKENQAKSEDKEVRPPVAATVGKLELAGRLLEGAIDVTAHVELSVLAADGWVTVRLLQKDAATRITRLPTVEHGVFSIAGGYLCFVTDKPGAYAFDLGFLTSAQATGPKRKAEIAYPDADSPGVLLKLGTKVATGTGPDGDIVGFSTLCPHKGFPLHYASADRAFNCPGHYSRFDAENGGMQIWGQATQNLPQFQLTIDDKGDIYASGVDELIYGRLSNVL